MKPIAIFRHAASEGPGYLNDFLHAHGVPTRLIAIDAGDAIPAFLPDFSGLVFMGGPMSVNDDLPWIPPVLTLIRQAIGAGMPVLGHCLGGQLMSRAMGGAVTANPVKEIGWGEVEVLPTFDSRRWFGDTTRFLGFHWHGETFSIPPGAVNLLASAHCAHQGFAMGRSFGFQCHIEMTADMVREWCRLGADEIAAAAESPGVATEAEITAALDRRIADLHAVAHRVYSAWLQGLTQGG